jgi:small subunit ribosomal protein S6
VKFYETGLILDPQLDEAGFDGEIKKVTDIIESNSGTIEKVDRWGVRRLAYLIKKKSQGYYTFIYYNSPPEVPRMIETMLRINENCLRFMTIVPDFKPDFEKAAQRERPRRQAEPTPEPEEKPSHEEQEEKNDKEEEEDI